MWYTVKVFVTLALKRKSLKRLSFYNFLYTFIDKYARRFASEDSKNLLQQIQWAFNGIDIFFHDMGINFGGFYISMTHKFLNHPDISAVFK